MTDTTVRNTYEIHADEIKINFNEHNLNLMLTQMQEAMGLPKQAVLTPHLHNLLIYEPGQFFKPHQDSEKLEGMVATLVIVLPSPHIGGDLLIHHNTVKKRFSSENIDSNQIQCFAFYADCQHEIEPVKQGYRIALTFNLVFHTEKNATDQSHENKALMKALQDYFDPDENSPTKLIYFLDHSFKNVYLYCNAGAIKTIK